MQGRVVKIISIEHPLPNPPPSRGRELCGNLNQEFLGFFITSLILKMFGSFVKKLKNL